MTANRDRCARGAARAGAALLVSLCCAEAVGRAHAQEEVPAGRVTIDLAPAEQEPEARDLSTLFEGHLLDTKNGQDLGLETQGYRRLLETLYSYQHEEVRARVEGELPWKEALANPDAWRGRFVRVTGMLAGLEAIRLRDPIGRNQDVYRGVVARADGEKPEKGGLNEGVVFDMFDVDPSQFDVQGSDRVAVRIQGLFYRTATYENRDGQMVTAPYVLARTLELFDTEIAEKKTAWYWSGTALVLAAVAYIVFRVLFSLQRRQHRRDATRGTGLQEALRERRMSAGQPPADKPR